MRAEYRSRQLPTSPQELNASYTAVPDAENAALGFLAAANAVVATSTEAEDNLPIVGANDTDKSRGPLQPEELQTAKDYLAKNAKSLELARAAARLKSARYPIDLTRNPSEIDIQHVDLVRRVARLFWLEGLVRAQEKNTAGAVESYSVAYATGRSLSTEPLLIAQLVVVAIEGQTAREIGIALSATAFPANDIDALALVVAQAPGIKAWGHAMAGEAVFALFDDSPSNPLAMPTLIFDRATYADTILTLFDASALPIKEAISHVESLENAEPLPLDRFTRPMSSMMTRAFARGFESVVRTEIYRDLLLIALAVEKYRLETNVLPENIDALVPKFLAVIPADPYGTGPYLYLREETGYAIYSVGRDRADGQGGKLRVLPKAGAPRHVNPPRDITLRIAR